MEMNLNIDFAGRYLLSTTDQSSTPLSVNISLLPGHLGNCDSNGTDEYEEFYRNAQFVSGLIVYPILCITGILGNSLSLIILSHKDMATSTNIYLLGNVCLLHCCLYPLLLLFVVVVIIIV